MGVFNNPIYLDEAATTKPKKSVIDAMMPYLETQWHNPSSLYSPAKSVRKAIEDSRHIIAKSIGAKDDEIYFTSSGSESNSWAIQGFVNRCNQHGYKPVVATSTIEHSSIMRCIENISAEVQLVSVDKTGNIDLNSLISVLKNTPDDSKVLVSIQFANNEIGTIQDIASIQNVVHKFGGVFHTDAVQAYGKEPIDVNYYNIDMMSVSGHKIGCPKGIGFLYIRDGVEISPIIFGSQENGMRGGTENVPYIIGFAEAVKNMNIENHRKKLHAIRNYMMYKLENKFGCTINGSVGLFRLCNNINVTFHQNITGEALIYMLETCGIFISSGSACNSHSNKPSHVLNAIGLSDDDISKSIRITIPDCMTREMVDRVILELWKQIEILTK